MPSFPRPAFDFDYNASEEIAALQRYRDTREGRATPAKQADNLLVATWNIANLGLQARRERDFRILAAIVGWFDVVALQEVNDNLGGLRGLLGELPDTYKAIFSDRAGNDERMAYVYDGSKAQVMEKVGEIAIPPKEYPSVKLPGIGDEFRGFDRNPYVCAFQANQFKVMLVNAHLYFGSDRDEDQHRRSLEAYAVARWADLRRQSNNAYVDKIIVLGDFNLPKVEPGDPVYSALTSRGLRRPAHSTRIASNIANDRDYDQIMFFPGQVKDRFTGRSGVFDYDGAIFARLWQKLVGDHGETVGKKRFKTYLRYYISDHRPLWAEFRTK